MRPYIIATDSAADLPLSYIKENNIVRCPVDYIVDGKEYGISIGEISKEDFYSALRNGKSVSTTAANPATIIDIMEEHVKNGYDILYISFSSALSSSYNNTVLAASTVCEDHPEATITVVDSLAVTSGLSLLVQYAVRQKEAGKTLQEAAAWLEENKKKLVQEFVVKDLFFLLRGGRLSKSSAIVGTALKINPLLAVNHEGKLDTIGKVRGRKRAISLLLDNMSEKMNPTLCDCAYITHSDCENDANLLADAVKERFHISDLTIMDMSPTIAVHSGPDALFIAYLGK